MKHKLLLFTFALAVSVAAHSQTDNSRNSETATKTSFVEAHIAKLKADITLAPQQETAIRTLLAKLYQDRNTAQNQANKASKAKIADKKVLHDAYRQQLDNILTEEQRIILQNKKQETLETIKSNNGNNANQ